MKRRGKSSPFLGFAGEEFSGDHFLIRSSLWMDHPQWWNSRKCVQNKLKIIGSKSIFRVTIDKYSQETFAKSSSDYQPKIRTIQEGSNPSGGGQRFDGEGAGFCRQGGIFFRWGGGWILFFRIKARRNSAPAPPILVTRRILLLLP